MRTATILTLIWTAFSAGCQKHQAEVDDAPRAWNNDWVTVKDIRVRLDRVALGKVPMTRTKRNGDTEPTSSDKSHLAVYYTVHNLSEERTFHGLFRTAVGVKLTDEMGNEYRNVSLWDVDKKTMESVRPQGQVDARIRIEPTVSVSDVITFEPPVDTANSLKLTLPGSAVHVEGDFIFSIPASAWR